MSLLMFVMFISSLYFFESSNPVSEYSLGMISFYLHRN